MPLYEVQSLDVWGNAHDGYEVNDRRSRGLLYVRPGGEMGGDDVVTGLIEAGHLNPAAEAAFRAGTLVLNSTGDGTIEISEEVEEPAEPEEGNENQLVDVGVRPLLVLVEEKIPHWYAYKFWSITLPTDKDEYPLEISANYATVVNRWQDGDNARETEAPVISFKIRAIGAGPSAVDRFDFYFLDWKKDGGSKRGLVGYSPGSGEPVYLTRAQLNSLLVALDKRMEQGPVKTKRYLAQTYGPQGGYAYEAVIPANQSWDEDTEWNTVMIDKDELGEEIGVVVIDGHEMRVWRADELS